MADETLLVLTGIGVAPYSARGLDQTLEPIGAAAGLRRTANGALLDVSAPQFRKYRSTISCSDFNTPVIDGVWPGQAVVVDCIAELSYPTGGSPGRTVVPGSSYTEGNHVFYRPRLAMRVVNFTTSRNEYQAVTGWSMELEET